MWRMWSVSILALTHLIIRSATSPVGAKELDELKASLDTIRSCAAGLIDAIEKQCPSLAVSRQRTMSATLER